MKVLIMGLPGAGKTTLASILAPCLGAVWFDADWVRDNLWPELGYGLEARVEQARRMGALCDAVNACGHHAVASFVCPTETTRRAFDASHTVWVDRIKEGRFADTNHMFTRPAHYSLRLEGGSPEEWADHAIRVLTE